MAEQQADEKPDATIRAAKIAVIGAIVTALIGATAGIAVALLQRKSSVPEAATPAPPGSFARKMFDEYALEGDNGVQQVLIGNYGVPADQIKSVDCPADQEVKAGNKFICIVQLDGDNPAAKAVDITVRDDSGQYEVGTLRDR